MKISRAMDCPICLRSNLTSTVTEVAFDATHLPIDSFKDAQGYEHVHDPNTTITWYECSNGHKFELMQDSACWCGCVGGGKA